MSARTPMNIDAIRIQLSSYEKKETTPAPTPMALDSIGEIPMVCGASLLERNLAHVAGKPQKAYFRGLIASQISALKKMDRFAGVDGVEGHHLNSKHAGGFSELLRAYCATTFAMAARKKAIFDLGWKRYHHAHAWIVFLPDHVHKYADKLCKTAADSNLSLDGSLFQVAHYGQFKVHRCSTIMNDE